MSKSGAKGAENIETECDNPVSLDEIEKGLWLGMSVGLKERKYKVKYRWPVSNVCVCVCVFLGGFSAASDVETLKQRNITHILTLDICPLPVHITALPFITTKYIHGNACKQLIIGQFTITTEFLLLLLFISVSDTPKNDLLCHFEECIGFISDALYSDKVVLVHWYECFMMISIYNSIKSYYFVYF